jgi:hypothetical protein
MHPEAIGGPLGSTHRVWDSLLKKPAEDTTVEVCNGDTPGSLTVERLKTKNAR